MRTTIDTAGRVVVPKQIRDRLGLKGGQEVEIEARDGRIEIEPVDTPMQLVERDGVLVAEPETSLPPLTQAQVRETLDQIRR